MAKSLKKLEALKLRKKGLSIKEISTIVGIAKSTVSLWCRDVTLSKIQTEKLYKRMVDAGHKGRMIGAEVNRQKKISVLDSVQVAATHEITSLSLRDIKMLALGLYWGEGSKDKQGRFVFVNSDPEAILLIIRWLESCMDTNKALLQPQIYINDQHKEREEVVLSYWSKKLSVPKVQFRKTIFIKVPHKKVYENYKTYMGVLHLTVSKSSYLKYKTMALLGRTQECVQKK
jgi:predicted transcriptional regulator